ncbi:uncharacterized protein LOC107476346 [Arachis duranensis]|uniref:Uncharacterized protein LOC107476346 n=1 Tax=Arachis duranensis TaxID=130453 RepID=A0A6P4CIQ4_ARADU|nr:uncharacterized protein LOC107476346 [Arachis duranensis]XP_057743788.1 uncharacterized protein LOC130961796 [Arachis stenosperma]XP_057743789.1 uncharacterized protein LOC130961796 [Arachis stenosperma]XP_057743790.1 uncharacterized protein LOC130961796 [Arachis stenosperma]
MENNGSNSNSHQNHTENSSADASKEKKDVFVNHAEIAWHQMRKEWVGNQSKKLQRSLKDSIMSLTTSYEDMLLSTEAFPLPIPLADMVDFLVDFWHDGGLYD